MTDTDHDEIDHEETGDDGTDHVGADGGTPTGTARAEACTDGGADGAPAGTAGDGRSAPRATERVDRIVDGLTLDEKIELVHGGVDPDGLATGYVPWNERHGVPPLATIDGPMGIRDVPATAFPASIALASAWDPELAREFGAALGDEALGAGQDVLLAPGFNLLRVPECGRAFEYYAEDPHLASRIGVGTIEGIQSRDVMATAKHFVANNQEADRHHVSADVSERALRELYLPAFEAAVREADVAAVMAAYNRVNGTHCTSNRRLLTDVLKEEWGFDGFVVADWWATHDGPAAAAAGLDLDMPGLPVYEWHAHDSPLFSLADALPEAAWSPKETVARLGERPWQPANPNPNVLDDSPFDEPLREAIETGELSESLLDGKIRRLLGQYERFGLFADDRPAGALDDPEHHDLARRIAERGTVLLENRDALPLESDADVALVGPHVDEAKVGGGGSSAVDPSRATSPVAGLRERAGPGGSVTVEHGIEPVGDASTHDDLLPDVELPFGETPRIEDAMNAAEAADVAVVVVQDLAREGEDRALELPGAQDELITAVAAAAERTVVVLRTAGTVAMPWADEVDAICQSWYSGQEDGHALASVLYGDVDPSGRLPVTVAVDAGDYPAADADRYPGTPAERYPGVDTGDGYPAAAYAEGVFVGYRHFDDAGIEPRYPFGHGLSYAAFEYRDATVSVPDGGAGDAVGSRDGRRTRRAAATVEVTVENVADRSGRTVVQCYVAPEDPPVERPPAELGAFAPVELDAGEAETVTLTLDDRAFAYYDEGDGVGESGGEDDWVVAGGAYELRIGASSRDVAERLRVQLPER